MKRRASKPWPRNVHRTHRLKTDREIPNLLQLHARTNLIRRTAVVGAGAVDIKASNVVVISAVAAVDVIAMNNSTRAAINSTAAVAVGGTIADAIIAADVQTRVGTSTNLPHRRASPFSSARSILKTNP